MKRKIIKRSIIILLAALTVFAGFKVLQSYSQLNKADVLYEDLRDRYVMPAADSHDSSGKDSSEVTEHEDGTSDPDHTVGNADTSETESGTEPITIRVNFDALLEENKDIVGWIYCEDSPISYPVVQAEDNDKYLRADLNGNYLVSGTVFVDCRNGSIGENSNYIIYGHNMDNGTMFGSLVNYKDPAYYEKHPSMQYLTPDGNYIISLAAGAVVDKNDILYLPDPGDAELDSYLEDIFSRSTFNSGITFEDGDIMVTLSTCSYEFDSARYVLIGKLIPVKS